MLCEAQSRRIMVLAPDSHKPQPTVQTGNQRARSVLWRTITLTKCTISTALTDSMTSSKGLTLITFKK